jgi:hypothetical protein
VKVTAHLTWGSSIVKHQRRTAKNHHITYSHINSLKHIWWCAALNTKYIIEAWFFLHKLNKWAIDILNSFWVLLVSLHGSQSCSVAINVGQVKRQYFLVIDLCSRVGSGLLMDLSHIQIVRTMLNTATLGPAFGCYFFSLYGLAQHPCYSTKACTI